MNELLVGQNSSVPVVQSDSSSQTIKNSVCIKPEMSIASPKFHLLIHSVLQDTSHMI